MAGANAEGVGLATRGNRTGGIGIDGRDDHRPAANGGIELLFDAGEIAVEIEMQPAERRNHGHVDSTAGLARNVDMAPGAGLTVEGRLPSFRGTEVCQIDRYTSFSPIFWGYGASIRPQNQLLVRLE
jgi:hypothetical protein